MAQKVVLNMQMAEAKELQGLGRRFYKDNSLGIPQACHVLLAALASGNYRLAKVRKKEPKEPAE